MHRTIKLSLLLGAAICVSLAPQAAKADLTGDSFHVTYYYPDQTSFYDDYGTYTAGGTGGNMNSAGPVNFVITGSQIIFTYTGDSSWNGTTFNGPSFTDLTENLGPRPSTPQQLHPAIPIPFSAWTVISSSSTGRAYLSSRGKPLLSISPRVLPLRRSLPLWRF